MRNLSDGDVKIAVASEKLRWKEAPESLSALPLMNIETISFCGDLKSVEAHDHVECLLPGDIIQSHGYLPMNIR